MITVDGEDKFSVGDTDCEFEVLVDAEGEVLWVIRGDFVVTSMEKEIIRYRQVFVKSSYPEFSSSPELVVTFFSLKFNVTFIKT